MDKPKVVEKVKDAAPVVEPKGNIAHKPVVSNRASDKYGCKIVQPSAKWNRGK